MVAQRSSGKSAPAAKVLDRLLRERGLSRYGLFFVTREGRRLPDGSEDASGYVVDPRGAIYFFWLGWDTSANSVAFTEWDEIEADPTWAEVAEYRRAREAVGLT